MGRKDKDGEQKLREDAERDGEQRNGEAGSHSFGASRGPGKTPGKSTLVAKRYGPPRARKTAKAENAHMSVEASESPEAGAALASWQGKTFFHVRPDEEPRAHYTAQEHRGQWQWSDPAGATLKVDSDAQGKSGQLLAEWAPARARYMEVDIEPLVASGRRPEEALHGHGPIELDPELITLEDTERLVAELDPSTRAAALMFFDSPAADAAGSDSAAQLASAGTRGLGVGPIGVRGSEDARAQGGAVGRRGGHEQGSEDPSWYRVEGAAIARQGGRTPTEQGQRGGSAGGQKDGTGNILGSGLLNIIDAPEEIAPLVNAGIILVEANVVNFGRGLFRRVLTGMTREAIEHEIAREAKTVIARGLRDRAKRLGKLKSFRELPEAEQERILKELERDIDREFYERLEKFARREAEEQEAVVIRLADVGDARSAHNRKVAAENADAYRQIEEAAARKTGGTVTVRPDDPLAARPYDPHATRAELEAEYPGAVTSSTVPTTGKPNVKLRGNRNVKSGAVHDVRGFPVFDDAAIYDTRLPRAVWSIPDRYTHMRAATRELRDAIEKGHVSASQFTPKQLDSIKKGDAKIPGYTWHHYQETGRMQLIPHNLHKDSSHIGGYGMWPSGDGR